MYKIPLTAGNGDAMWMKVKLTPDQVSTGLAGQIIDTFSQRWIAAGAPREAAIYGVTEDIYQFYVTPAGRPFIADLLHRLNAVECDHPDRSTLSVWVANDNI